MKQELTREFFVQKGRKGGLKTKKRGKAYFKRIGKLGGIARKNNETKTQQ
jgi:hypothetical protein